jgi:hypothetical protein
MNRELDVETQGPDGDITTAAANQPGMPAGELRGYDGLQRMTAHRWLEANLDASGFVTSYVPTTSVVGFQHAFDAADNKLSEARLHDSGNSEAYDYDSAYRLNEFDRGTLNTSLDEVTTPTTTPGLLQAQDWTLDGPGNWPTNVTTTGGTPTTENRTHNNLNQITAVGPTALQTTPMATSPTTARTRLRGTRRTDCGL